MKLKIDPTTQSTNVGSDELNNFDDLLQWIHKIFEVRIQSFMDAQHAEHHQHVEFERAATLYGMQYHVCSRYHVLEEFEKYIMAATLYGMQYHVCSLRECLLTKPESRLLNAHIYLVNHYYFF